jgi:hypothetical protein
VFFRVCFKNFKTLWDAVTQSSDRQLEVGLRSNFFMVLSLWIVASVLPTFICGLAPTLLPKVLADFWSLEHALSLWAGMASLTMTIFWPLGLLSVEERSFQEERRLWIESFKSLTLLGIVSLPSLTLVSGLALVPLAHCLKAALYLTFLALTALFAVRLSRPTRRPEQRRIWALFIGLGMSCAYPLFLKLGSIFEDRDFATFYSWLSPPLAVQEILAGGSILWALLHWFGLCLLFFAGFYMRRLYLNRLTATVICLLVLWPQSGFAKEDAFTISRVETLLSGKARVGHSYPIRFHIGRRAPGVWKGQLAIRLGRRSFRAPVEVFGGTQNAPQQLDLVLVFNERQAMVLESISETGESSILPFSSPTAELIEEGQVLIGAWGQDALPWAEEFAKQAAMSSKSSTPLLIEPSLHQSLGLNGEALDLLFVGSHLSRRSRIVSLLRYVAQGGIVVLYGEARHAAKEFPGTLIRQGPLQIGRLGSGLLLQSNSLSLNKNSLDDLTTLLEPRFSGISRGRVDLSGFLESFYQAPQMPRTQLGLRFALASFLVAIVLILSLYGFPRAQGKPGQSTQAAYELFGLFSQQVIGGMLVVALTLVLIMKWVLLPASLTSLETLCIEEVVVGTSWVDQSSFLKLRTALDAPGQTLNLALNTQLRDMRQDSGSVRPEDLIEKLSSTEKRLTINLRAGATPLFLVKDLRPSGRGLRVFKKGDAWILENGSLLAMTKILIVRGENSAWIPYLDANESKSLNLEEKPYYQWLEGELKSSFERRLYYHFLPQRESYTKEGGVILCQPEDDGSRRQLGAIGLEVAPMRILMATWLDQELKKN